MSMQGTSGGRMYATTGGEEMSQKLLTFYNYWPRKLEHCEDKQLPPQAVVQQITQSEFDDSKSIMFLLEKITRHFL